MKWEGKSVLSIGEEKLDQEHWLPWTVLDTMRQGPRWVGSFPLHEGEELLGLCVFLFFELTFHYTENIARLCDLQAQWLKLQASLRSITIESHNDSKAHKNHANETTREIQLTACNHYQKWHQISFTYILKNAFEI